MGKVLRLVAVIALTAAVAYFAPQLAPGLLHAVGVTGAAVTAGATAAAIGVISAVGMIAGTLLINAVIPAPSAKNNGAGGGALQNFRQTISASFIIYGQRRVGGLLVFFHPKGKDWRYFVIACAGHRCKGVVGWWLNDEKVDVDGSGLVTSGKYANHAWLWFARGEADQVANATFVAECDGKWTANHRGRGVAAIYAKFEMVDAVVQAGMPTITAEIEGKDDVVDPRTGEEGYTRLATPIMYDWLRLPREEGGFGAAADEVPDDATLAAWTNICDEDVATPDGSEKRYLLDVFMTTGSAPSEVRSGLLACVAGTYTYAEGRFIMRPGYWNPVSKTLSEDDLAGGINVPLLADPQSIATEIGGTFIDPASNYQSQPIPIRSTDAADIVQSDIDLPHITSVYRAQRIADIALKRSQCEKRVTWPMNLAGLGVSALDTVQLGTTRYGLSNYAFVVDGWSLSPDYSVSLVLREENEDIYEDPTSYGTTAGAPALAVAEPIEQTYARGAHRIASQDVAYPLSSTDTTIAIAAFNAVLDDGTVLSLPADTVAGLPSAAVYDVFWDRQIADYIAPTSPAPTQWGDQRYVWIGSQATSSGGTYTPPETPPDGYHGGGRGGNPIP